MSVVLLCEGMVDAGLAEPGADQAAEEAASPVVRWQERAPAPRPVQPRQLP